MKGKCFFFFFFWFVSLIVFNILYPSIRSIYSIVVKFHSSTYNSFGAFLCFVQQFHFTAEKDRICFDSTILRLVIV